MVLRVIFWTQEGESERMVLDGIFGHKREKVRGGWC